MDKNFEIARGASRMEKVNPSLIRTVLNRASEMIAEGKPVIKFSAGEPDFNTPSDIKEAAIRALTNNQTHYCSNKGIAELRKKLQKYIRMQTGVTYDSETEILITSGAAEALNNVIMSFVDRDDEVIILEPAFVSYNNLVAEAGGREVRLQLEPEDHFQINIERLRAAITNKTKMLILNNPSNPTGAVFAKESLAEIARLSEEKNFLVLSDEIYSRLVYGAEFISMASFPGMKKRAIIVSGFSKTFAMTGWRLGYLSCDAELMSVIIRNHQYSTTCTATFIQLGTAEGMDTERTKREVEDMIASFARRRKLIMSKLDEIEELSYVVPQGAFYIMVDVRGLGMSGTEFSHKLLEEKFVATVPAVGLGESTDSFVRFAYSTSDAAIAEGMERIKGMVSEIKAGQ